MSTILIKTSNSENDSFILKLAKLLHLRARVLDEDDENDLLLINSINKGIKSGEAASKEVEDFFRAHGVKIH